MLDGWSNYRLLKLYSNILLINYPIKVVIHRSTGTDSDDDIYIGTKCKSDYSDIRFTSISDVVYSHWIEFATPESAIIWVKLPKIKGDGITDIYLQYGNISAVDTSNGSDTFPLFFDDFSSSSLDTSKWTGTGDISIANGLLSITSNTYSTQQGITSKSSFSQGYTVTTKIKVNRHDNINAWFYTGFQSGSYTKISIYNSRTDISNYVSGTGTYSATISNTQLTEEWHTLELKRPKTTSSIGTIDYIESNSLTSSIPTTALPIIINCYTSTSGNHGNLEIDYIFIREYVEIEPIKVHIYNPSAYSYRKHCIISSDATALDDHQIKIIIYYDAGVTVDNQIYLGSQIFGARCNPDFSDIQFTNKDGIILPYWIESYTTGISAIVWVKVDTINTTSELYIYYGNPNAVGLSDGENTFIFFDNFNAGSLDTTKWTYGLTPTISYGILTLNQYNEYIQSINTFGIDTIFRSRLSSTAVLYAYFGYSGGTSSLVAPYTTFRTGSSSTTNNCISYVSSSLSNTFSPIANGTYKIYEITRNSGISNIFNVNDSVVVTHSSQVSSNSIPIHIFSATNGPVINIDWVSIRSYTDQEIIYNEWSEEERNVLYDLYIEIIPTSGIDPLTITFNIFATKSALNNFILNFGDGQTYTANIVTRVTISHTYDTPGTYTVWAEGYNDFATHVFYEIPYGVTASSQVVTTSFTYNQSNNVVQFTDTSTGSVNEWYWTFGDGSYSYEQNPHHTYTSIGTYTVTLYSSNQYQYGLYSIEIPVSTFTYVYPPVPNFKPACLNVITDDLPCSVQFTDLSFPTTGCTYYWTFGDTSTSTSQNPLHSYASLGVYDVSLTVTNDYGSSTITYEDCIKIHNEAKIFKENLTYNDEFSTFGIMLFIETPTYSDIFIKAKVFTDNCYYTQGEFPSDPGIDEYCNLSFYTNINEYCETLFDNVTDYLKRTVIDPVMSVLGFQKLKMKEFTETVYYDDVLSLEPPT